ncbi:hypothetical protein [Candidatus Frankia alpina]|uniref:hypothetical protein n=1 Tax=Candidatus Frankia alpina TaxID=2699483 RepID=UPI003013344B
MPDGLDADLLVVAARTEAGVGLFAVDSAADGLSRSELEAPRPGAPGQRGRGAADGPDG